MTTTSPSRSAWTALLCWLTVLIEGYDLVALGATIPILLKSHYLGFTSAGATAVATVSLVGVAVGAASLTPLTDRFGRRLVLIGSVLLFSLFTVLVPIAPNVAVFGVFRFAAGLGLGACMPVALTVMAENLPIGRRAGATTFTMTGYHVGAVLTSVLALSAGENWRLLFYGGGLVGLAAVPLMWWRLPESEAYLAAKQGPEWQPFDVRELLGPRYRRISLAVWVGSFMGLLLVYGLNTWLPQLMHTAGYPISTSITLLLILNIGAVTGLLLGGVIANRVGILPIVRIWFGAGAVLLALLSMHIGNRLLLDALVLLTGVFVFSAQVLIYGYVTQVFPAQARGTALGMASAVGRIGSIVGPFVTGALVTAGIANPWGFWFFAVVAALGLVAILLLGSRTAEAMRTTSVRRPAV